ncbi:S8 family serine peptidase [Amycolatopsis suaedae]|uniref:Protease n=1 Tax=Amycolatopsis suaedae TaxID=2510978 RepID=A0A4Q7J7P5_9PSEU|nr:S8 family serine peptidase [Amycolatopsis suaedae]RZQ63700.1 protease [Amycolatopsis suaedae]
MTNAAGGSGRYLVLVARGESAAGIDSIAQVAGLRPTRSAELAGASVASVLNESDGLLFDELGVAVLNAGPDQADALTATSLREGPITLVEAERTVYAYGAPAAQPAAVDETQFTWGLQAVGAPQSPMTGKGVRVAVLDTGFDAAHPDFAGRVVVTSSFIQGEDAADGHGHGTHCIGTACGPRDAAEGPGYGVAHEAEIYAGKVLSNAGTGSDGGILSGISWAISNGCAVVSMSLGADVQPGTPFSPLFEQIAQRALAQGTLIIAATGNASKRSQGSIAPVGHPANCPSIFAVGAVDVAGAIADFSSGTADDIGAVDLAGPGVDVYSSWPGQQRYHTISGTSMATPHVSGVAALLAQQGAKGMDLWARLSQTARRLPLPSTDVGAGLAQAPR